jgi:hypothetical protein
MAAYVIARAMIRTLLFVIEHAAVLALLLFVAAAAGTAVAGSRTPLVLRSVLGLAVAGQIFILLGSICALRPWAICAFCAIAIAGGAARMGKVAIRWRVLVASALTVAPLFVLALFPPVAFDETLYHLPFVRAIASSGAIRFLPDARFPVFPQLHEVLCVPPFLLLGDTATHLVALAEVLLLAALLVEWPRSRLAGFLAAAVFLGNPIVVQLATITYVDAAMALFVVAGLLCLDRYPVAAGFLLGSACSVKYLGWYFAAAAIAYLLLFGTNRRRTIPLVLGSLFIAVLPMYAQIIALTGNPFFPFLPKVFGPSAWTLPMPEPIAPSERVVEVLRVFWDATFARERLNHQPPYSPLFAVAMLVTVVVSTRDRRAAFLSALCAGYIAIFTFLPQDARYLLPLLPLLSVAAASAVAASLKRRPIIIALSLLCIAPGVLYAGYRLMRQGSPPLTATQRRVYLEEHIAEYRALEHRGPGRVYVCGAEQMKYFGGDDVVGDVSGPLANETILGNSRDPETLASTLTRFRIHYLLASRKSCPEEWQRVLEAPSFERVYADSGAVLWRVVAPSPTAFR